MLVIVVLSNKAKGKNGVWILFEENWSWHLFLRAIVCGLPPELRKRQKQAQTFLLCSVSTKSVKPAIVRKKCWMSTSFKKRSAKMTDLAHCHQSCDTPPCSRKNEHSRATTSNWKFNLLYEISRSARFDGYHGQ